MIFLTDLRVTGIICSFSLVTEKEQTGKEIPESSWELQLISPGLSVPQESLISHCDGH